MAQIEFLNKTLLHTTPGGTPYGTGTTKDTADKLEAGWLLTLPRLGHPLEGCVME